jgi:hypothetical protein
LTSHCGRMALTELRINRPSGTCRYHEEGTASLGICHPKDWSGQPFWTGARVAFLKIPRRLCLSCQVALGSQSGDRSAGRMPLAIEEMGWKSS